MGIAEKFEDMVLGGRHDSCRPRIVRMAYALGFSTFIANMAYILSQISDGHVTVLIAATIEPLAMFLSKIVGVINSITTSSLVMAVIKSIFVFSAFFPVVVCIFGPFLMVLNSARDGGMKNHLIPIVLSINWALVGMTIISGR